MKASLFTELRLRDVSFKNRIAVSPMAQYAGVNGAAQPWHIQHLGSLAVSGPGLVCIESTSVEREGYGSKTCLALHTDEQEDALRHVIASIRSFSDTPFGIQFGHSGRKGSGADPRDGRRALRPDEGAWALYGPSALPFSEQWPTPTALDRAGLDRVIHSYIQAAERAARIDLSLIELHGAHGYLLHSFLSPISNQRTDDYGGSLQNRMRLIMEVTQAVRQVWPAQRALGIRLNAQDWVEGGLTIDDTVEIARAFKASGGDYVTISAGAISSAARIPSAPGYLAPFSAQVRRQASIPTIVTGFILTPQQANQIIEDGSADMVAIARAFLDDPRWVWRAGEALGVDVPYPMQYMLAKPPTWPGRKLIRDNTAGVPA